MIHLLIQSTQPSATVLPPEAIVVVGLIVPVIIKILGPYLAKLPVLNQIPIAQYSVAITTILTAIATFATAYFPANYWTAIAPVVAVILGHAWHGSGAISTVSAPSPGAVKASLMALFVGAAAMLSGCSNAVQSYAASESAAYQPIHNYLSGPTGAIARDSTLNAAQQAGLQQDDTDIYNGLKSAASGTAAPATTQPLP